MLKALLSALAFLALCALGVLVVFVTWNLRDNDDEEEGTTPTELVTTAPPETGATTAPPEEEPRVESWPLYGFDAQRRRFAPDFALRPPFRKLWMVRGRSLIEFPPVVAYGRLYFGTNAGRFLAVEAETGKIAWEKKYRRCIAASPAIADDVVYVPLMFPHPCAQPDPDATGFVAALDADTGEPLWRFRAGVVESSPLVADGLLYFGSWDGKVYAVDVETHDVAWAFETDDQVKAGPALAGDTIYIGSYDGQFYALDAETGEERWSTGLGGDFYATPTVAGQLVFAGNTNGNVYAFDAASGDVVWVKDTGDAVYSSAAVWKRRVYVGSRDGNFYALDVKTGEERWVFEGEEPIAGSPTVLDGLVYFSAGRRTYALDARTGRRRWSFPDGKFTPLVADAERAYLTGYTRVYGLEPTERVTAGGTVRPR